MIFRLGGRTVMKNEKWIVFPESRYVNSNPANLSKNYLVTITHSPLKTSPYVQCNFIAEDMKYFNILQIINYNTNSSFLRSSSLMHWSGSLIKILSVSDHNFFILKFHCFMTFLNFITSKYSFFRWIKHMVPVFPTGLGCGHICFLTFA